MTVIKWAPLRDLNVLQQQMEWLCEGAESQHFGFTPAAEMVVTDSSACAKGDRDITIYLDLPGVDPAHIDVQATAKTITIIGERLAKETEGEISNRSELRYGKFQRIISLPEKVQHDQVTAKYEQGVLQLTLPKLVEDKDKIVKVEITH
jgi:HSP20 family protein